MALPTFKRSIAIVLLLGWFGLPAEAQETCVSTDALTWMLGSWRGQEEDTVFLEQWTRAPDGKLLGYAESFSEESGERFMTERMVIEAGEGELSYQATVSSNPGPVTFRLVSCGEATARWENPDNEFPQALEYKATEEGLRASVTNLDGQGFDLEFEAVNGPQSEPQPET